jgi:tRNA nucleotidyltransferase/poly(A) polymerase
MLKDKYSFIEIGESFGVVFVLAGEDQFEIATFREEEGYSDSRRPDEVKFSTIDKDVLRRDLTINALFYDIDKEEIVDLVGGVDDILNGVVRTVGNADDRFTEDRLRILRAVRFVCRLGFKMDIDIFSSIQKNPSLRKVSKERIRDEFMKCVKSAKDISILRGFLSELGLDKQIFPGLNLEFSFTDETPDFEIILALALINNPVKKIRSVLNKLTYTNDEVSRISFLVESLKLKESNAFAMKKAYLKSKVNDLHFVVFHAIAGSDKNLFRTLVDFQLSVSGDKLIEEEGFVQGAELGAEIKKRETKMFIDELKEKEA